MLAWGDILTTPCGRGHGDMTRFFARVALVMHGY